MSPAQPDELMAKALELALQGRGQVEPNPRVGALVLQAGQVVGQGCHAYFGGPHAEVAALTDAESKGAKPDTLVVTLEPCSSLPGQLGKKTPPCTQAILAAGIKTVIVGAQDPDPRHQGQGLQDLQAAGLQVQSGVLARKCEEINKPFARWLGLDRPWLLAKWAMTLDGKTASPSGDSRWISGEESRRQVHLLRSRVDAVMVGFRTVLQDDPMLTVRHVSGQHPKRVVVDPLAQIPLQSKLVQTAREVPTCLLVGPKAEADNLQALQDLGVVILSVPQGAGGERSLHLEQAMRDLRQQGIRRLLVEGGGALMWQLFDAGCVDQVSCYLAPKIFGGQAASSPVAGTGFSEMAQAMQLSELHWQGCGEDLCLGGFVA